MKSERGIYLDIKESDYKFMCYGYNFYFSSLFYLNKFKSEIDSYILTESIKIKNKYQIRKINIDLFFALSLYIKIEKRGFKVFDILHNINYYNINDIELIVKIKE